MGYTPKKILGEAQFLDEFIESYVMSEGVESLINEALETL